MKTRIRHLIVAVAVIFVLPSGSLAQTYWEVDNGNWADDPNWSAGEPTASDDAIISNNGRCNLVYAGEECYSLTIGDGAGESGLLVIYNNGNLTATYLRVGLDGTGTVTHAAGTSTISANVTLGSNAGSYGTYGMSGTAQLTTADDRVQTKGQGPPEPPAHGVCQREMMHIIPGIL